MVAVKCVCHGALYNGGTLYHETKGGCLHRTTRPSLTSPVHNRRAGSTVDTKNVRHPRNVAENGAPGVGFVANQADVSSRRGKTKMLGLATNLTSKKTLPTINSDVTIPYEKRLQKKAWA